MPQKQHETTLEEKLSSAVCSKSIPSSEHKSASAPQGEVLIEAQDKSSAAIRTESITTGVQTLTEPPHSRSRVAPNLAGVLETKGHITTTLQNNAPGKPIQITATLQSQTLVGSQSANGGSSEKDFANDLHTASSVAFQNMSVAAEPQIESTCTAGQVKSTLALQTKSSAEKKSVPEVLIKSTTTLQKKTAAAPQNKPTATLEIKRTLPSHNNKKKKAASQSKDATKQQAKGTTATQSKRALASQNKTAVGSTRKQTAGSQTKHAPDLQGKSSVPFPQSKNTVDNIQPKITQTHPPSVLPAIKGNKISSPVETNVIEKEVQSSQKAVFVPLTLVGPPVPKLADAKHWSSAPLQTHCVPSIVPDLSSQWVIDQISVAGKVETSSDNVSTDSVSSGTDSSSVHASPFQESDQSASLVSSAATEEHFSFVSFMDVPQLSFLDVGVGQSISYASAAQKPPVSLAAGVTGLPRSVNPFGQPGSSSSGAGVTKKREPRKRSRGKKRGGKAKTKASKVNAFAESASAMPHGIKADVGSVPTIFKACGKEPTSFAPLPNGQVWLVYGARDPHIDLIDEDGIIERVRIGGNAFHVSCMSDDCVVLLCHSPYPQLQLFDSRRKTTEMHPLHFKPSSFSVGFTGIAVCGYRSLLWITLHNGDKEWVVPEENSNFIKVCSCAVMFRNGKEVICVADKSGHAVFFFEKNFGKGATSLEPYTGAGLYLVDQKEKFTPICVSVHSAGFLGILDATSQSALILDSKLSLTSVISREHLCCGNPSVIAFSADSSCKLWVASDPGPVCLAPLLFQS